MWCVRTFQWKGNWIGTNINFEFKILILNFEMYLEFKKFKFNLL